MQKTDPGEGLLVPEKQAKKILSHSTVNGQLLSCKNDIRLVL